MKIAIAQLNYLIGDFEGNLHKMLDSVSWAKAQGADLICFSELSTCGYPPRDFLEFSDFIRRAERSIDHLKGASDGIAIVVGSPTINPVVEGKDLHNSAYFLYDRKVVRVVHKTLLPTYDVFDEYRYFEPAVRWQVVPFKGKKIAVTICEDIWNIGNENPLYTVCPMDRMMDQGPDFILNLSASPFSYDQAKERLKVIRANVERYQIPMFYVNHCGAQTELIFDGGSVVMQPDGSFVELDYFSEQCCCFDLDQPLTQGLTSRQSKDKIALIHDALVLGIKDYFGKLGFQSAILGLSGGIDSAVTAVLAARALGPENVHCILMPSAYSSEHSVKDALDLVSNLQCNHQIIRINEIFEAFLEELKPSFEGTKPNVTEENLQARSRGVLLMALSNKFGHILLNTTNKSEMAVGYGTLYGDLCGGLSVIGDVYKTDVYRLAAFINKDGEIIPKNTIDKAPSAELRPNQKDTDSLPEYDRLDAILYQYIEQCKGPKEIVRMGFDKGLVERILRLVNINEFKRYQTAPVLRVSTKAFGQGRRMPIVGKYLNESDSLL